MTRYTDVLNNAYEALDHVNLRAVWGIAVGVFFGWLFMVLPREIAELVRR